MCELTSANSASAKVARPGQPCQLERRSSTDRGEHADHGVEAAGPVAAGGQREPEHCANAERDQYRFQPKLRAKSPYRGGPQKTGCSERGTGEK